MKSRLVVMLTKYPEKGKVKTRLANKIGFEKAAIIQEKFIIELLKNNYFIKNDDYDFKICLSPKDKIKVFSDKFGVELSDIFSVKKGKLGKVMKKIFKYLLKEYEEVILIGSDIPKLSNYDFLDGFSILQDSDIALGPSFDGGYYLIGMKNRNNFLFENILYSTETVLYETIDKCNTNNLTYSLTDMNLDIDTYDDLVQVTKIDRSGFFSKLMTDLNLITKHTNE